MGPDSADETRLRGGFVPPGKKIDGASCSLKLVIVSVLGSGGLTVSDPTAPDTPYRYVGKVIMVSGIAKVSDPVSPTVADDDLGYRA